MKKGFNRGFTLIELLVVIAIIGILSSVVLASLNTARGKGADAAIKSNLNNIRAQAEIIYDGVTPNSYATVCADAATVQKALIAARSAAGATLANEYTLATVGALDKVTCHSSATAWAAESPLKSNPAQFWCVDSTGSSGIQTGFQLEAGNADCL